MPFFHLTDRFFFLAANTFLRSIFAAALPLVAQPLFNNLGVQWSVPLNARVSVLADTLSRQGVYPLRLYRRLIGWRSVLAVQ